MRDAGRIGPALLLAAALAACAGARGHDAVEFVWDFAISDYGWTGAFADYPVGGAAAMELTFAHRALPPPLHRERRALHLSGINRSDDLFMYVKRRVEGLRPGAVYAATFVVEMATDAGTGCPGAGGAPGESVVVKAGAAAVEPRPVVVGGDHRLNVDKGDQAQGGRHAVVLGNAANATHECAKPVYELKTLTGTLDGVTPGPDGSLWVFVGTDSGHEGRTSLYYRAIRVALERR